jgi:hypothetical protein
MRVLLEFNGRFRSIGLPLNQLLPVPLNFEFRFRIWSSLEFLHRIFLATFGLPTIYYSSAALMERTRELFLGFGSRIGTPTDSSAVGGVESVRRVLENRGVVGFPVSLRILAALDSPLPVSSYTPRERAW